MYLLNTCSVQNITLGAVEICEHLRSLLFLPENSWILLTEIVQLVEEHREMCFKNVSIPESKDKEAGKEVDRSQKK